MSRDRPPLRAALSGLPPAEPGVLLLGQPGLTWLSWAGAASLGRHQPLLAGRPPASWRVPSAGAGAAAPEPPRCPLRPSSAHEGRPSAGPQGGPGAGQGQPTATRRHARRGSRRGRRRPIQRAGAGANASGLRRVRRRRRRRRAAPGGQAAPRVPQCGRRLARAAPGALANRGPIEGRAPWAPGIDRPGALGGPAGPRLARAVRGLDAGQPRWTRRRGAAAPDCRGGAGPRARRLAARRAGGALALPGRCRGARAHAARGHALWAPWQAGEGLALIQAPDPAALAQARDRLEPVPGVGLGLWGCGDAGQRPGPPPLVLVGAQGEGHREAWGDGGSGEAWTRAWGRSRAACPACEAAAQASTAPPAGACAASGAGARPAAPASPRASQTLGAPGRLAGARRCAGPRGGQVGLSPRGAPAGRGRARGAKAAAPARLGQQASTT